MEKAYQRVVYDILLKENISTIIRGNIINSMSGVAMASSCNISLRIPVSGVFIGKTLFMLIKAIFNIDVSYPTGAIIKIFAESIKGVGGREVSDTGG